MKTGWVYLLKTGWHYKIGKSKDVRKRVASLQTASPYLIELVCAVETSDMDFLERWLHGFYKEYRTNGEWFELPEHVVDSVVDDMLTPLEDDFAIGGDLWARYMESGFALQQCRKQAQLWFPTIEIMRGWAGYLQELGEEYFSVPDFEWSSTDIGMYKAWANRFFIYPDNNLPDNERIAELSCSLAWDSIISTDEGFLPGDIVQHNVFGLGCVICLCTFSKYGRGAIVDFARHGIRCLATEIANLQVVGVFA
jgi:hypothetical protein